MTDHPNAQLVRDGYQAFVAGDMQWLNDHLHEEVVWHNPGGNLLSGDHRGREAVLAFFAKSVQIAIPELDIHDVLANDDHVVGLVSSKFTRNDNGQSYETRAAQVFHIDAQGRALEVWTMNEDQAGFDRFLEGAQA